MYKGEAPRPVIDGFILITAVRLKQQNELTSADAKQGKAYDIQLCSRRVQQRCIEGLECIRLRLPTCHLTAPRKRGPV